MRENPKPQEIYRHFKGKIYQIITLAHDSETLADMVVYQQLYAPYEAYVRPLDMFMSEVDHAKYPEVKQLYRFEKITPVIDGENVKPKEKMAEIAMAEIATTENIKPKEILTESIEYTLDPALIEFLDAKSYEAKLEILSRLHPRITDDMINTMAVSLDTEVKEGDIETRYNEIKSCLLTMERFECNRLR
jgi:hypothetical protein